MITWVIWVAINTILEFLQEEGKGRLQADTEEKTHGRRGNVAREAERTVM